MICLFDHFRLFIQVQLSLVVNLSECYLTFNFFNNNVSNKQYCFHWYTMYDFSLSDFSCALSREILLQGRIYISQGWFCFYSNIFGWETQVSTCILLTPSKLLIWWTTNDLTNYCYEHNNEVAIRQASTELCFSRNYPLIPLLEGFVVPTHHPSRNSNLQSVASYFSLKLFCLVDSPPSWNLIFQWVGYGCISDWNCTSNTCMNH